MPEVERFFDDIDRARNQRARELSEIKRTFLAISSADPLAIGSKSVVVLTYAIWEGFYNDCVSCYIDFLRDANLKVSDVRWELLAGTMSGDFNSLRDKHHSDDARQKFVERLRERLSCGFDKFDRSIVMSRSNLDFEKLSANFGLLGFDISPFLRQRLRIDKELVGWRHGVAHGDPPDLSRVDAAGHIEFTSQLLLAIADCFQHAILTYV